MRARELHDGDKAQYYCYKAFLDECANSDDGEPMEKMYRFLLHVSSTLMRAAEGALSILSATGAYGG